MLLKKLYFVHHKKCLFFQNLVWNFNIHIFHYLILLNFVPQVQEMVASYFYLSDHGEHPQFCTVVNSYLNCGQGFEL